MLIFDQLKKEDPQLRVLSLGILAALGVLMAGLWWVQIVSARDYQANLETQSFRTVRIPAVRGKILDRDGVVLAENRPTYSICLYLEELRGAFAQEFINSRPAHIVTNSIHFWQRWIGTKAVRREYVKLNREQLEACAAEARYRVASNVVASISQRLGLPLALDRKQFERHYRDRLALPFEVAANLNPTNIARFEEQCDGSTGVSLEVQSTRWYPYGSLAAHTLGHLTSETNSHKGEDATFSYRLPDVRGALGIERAYDIELRGLAGTKSVQVNNMGYRTMETVWTPAEPGQDVVLTINAKVQQAAEQALPVYGAANTHSAAVVMDVRNGDILALASCPAFDPNYFVRRGDFPRDYYQRLLELQAEKNRATFELYAPGSVFKTIVGLAALEAGMDPSQEVEVLANPRNPSRGCYKFKSGAVKRDTVTPGPYNFTRALMKSSNAYFITQAIHYGPEGIVRIAQHLHFDERFGLNTGQESKGYLPTLERIHSGWTEEDTGNMAIGQAPVIVTPLEIAVLASALANGGTVLTPRLVSRIQPADPLTGGPAKVFPAGVVRDHLGVSARSMQLLHKAMLADTEDDEGSGKRARIPGLHICAKTGTAQVQDIHNQLTEDDTWIASFAPYERPQYAVVVMVEKGRSGGETCAPIAGKIYEAIKRELIDAPRTGVALAARTQQ